MKRFISVLLITTMVLLVHTPFVFADNNNNFVVHDETYVPREKNFATREEAVASFIKAVGFDTAAANLDALNKFSDNDKIAAVYAREIASAVEAHFVSGYEDGSFRPQGAITRCEALVILSRILGDRTLPSVSNGTFSDTPEWAKNDIDRLATSGIVKGYGDGTLGAKDFLTSEQVSILASRAIRMVGPMGDYYEYINEEWIENTKLPDGYAAWSDADVISGEIMKEIGDVVYSLNKRKYKNLENFEEGTSEQKIVDVFTAGGNSVYRDKLGLEPVAKYLEMIDRVKNTDEALKVMAALERAGYPGLLSMKVSADFEDSSKYILAYTDCYTGMNSASAIGDVTEQDVTAYKEYITNLFILHGVNEVRAGDRAKKVADLCAKLVKASMTTEKKNDIELNYKVYSKDIWKNVFSKIDIGKYLKYLGFSSVDKILIYNLPLAETVNGLLISDNLELIKDYMRAAVMDVSAMYLNTDAFLVKRGYKDKLNGTESGALPADYAVTNVEELLGWDLAKLYVEKYASASDKAAIESMTKSILDAYKSRLRKNKWLSASSLGAAINKIDNLKIKVGYPENINDYINPDYKIKSTAEGGNLIEYRADYFEQYFIASAAALSGKTDSSNRDVWSILPQTVNSMYEPSTNSITIPAAMLKKPFYDPKASYETNLGGIGAVIAHEISHALDSVGSRFDENGNMKDWWLPEDKEAFDEICKKVTEEYNKIEFIPGGYVNGKLTLNENLADLAGMACILDIAGKDNPRLLNLFENYAVCWRIRSTDEYKKGMLKVDSHSPDKVRVNRVLSNYDEFHGLFGVIEGDGMYLPEERRIKIW